MAFKASPIHWEIIIEFMEKHSDLAKGFISSGPSVKDIAKKLWEELAAQLNSAGLGERPTKKWQKTWTDFKHLLKKKAAGLKLEQNLTGGGPSHIAGLSDIEKRILGILGPLFYKGIGRSENGCNFGVHHQNNDDVYIHERANPDADDSFINDEKASCSFRDPSLSNVSQPNSSISRELGSSQKNTNIKVKATRPVTSTIVGDKRPLIDHDYLKKPMETGQKRVKAKMDDFMEAMYKETLNELREIKSSLRGLSECGKGIQSALEKIADK